MKKLYYLSSLFLISGVLTGYSTPLTPQEALSRLNNSREARRISSQGSNYELRYSFKDSNNTASLYVFGRTDSKGFVLLSADDAACPVLGYSDNGSFDPANIPPQLDNWLKEYSCQIDYMRSMNAPAYESSLPSSLEGKEAISPLVESKWNQGAPYNKYCFTIAANGEETQSVTGCVATSMAQVMYYYKYPEIGHGSISYKHGDSGTYSMDFGAQAFEWDEMLPTYYPDSYNEKEADAVAYLMKSCGYSVKMDYSKGEAGASGPAIAGALIDYFGYNDAIEVQTRDFYTYDSWASMIYDNLKNVGPLVYDGSALDGGHSFVCDGYDGNGYFHFNWGWGGMSDGYYLLDALNPDEFGIGGAAGGYNLGQQVILNISPKKIETGVPQLMQFGNVTGKVSGSILSLSLEDAADPGFQYINPAPVTLTFGLKVENVNDASKEPQYYSSSKKDLEAKQGSYFKWEETGTTLDLEKTGMTEGQQYNIIISTDITQGDATSWSEVQAMPGKANYVTVIKKSDGYEVINHTPGNLTVSDFQILSSPIYYDKPVKFSAGFTNSSTQQLTRNYSAVFFNSEGEECYKMENYSINVDGNQSTTDTWTSVNWYKEKGATEIKEATDFKVKLYDNWQGSYVEGIEETVTVMPTTPDAKVESEFEITNGTKEGDVYIVEGNQLDVSLTVKVLDGFFNHTMMLAIQAPLNDKDYFTIMHKHFDAIPDLSAGEEQVFDMSVIFEQAEPDKVYRVEVWGQGSGFNESRLVKFNLPTSGINHISPDSEGNYKIFNLDGTLRSITSDPTIIKSLPRGIYIINGRKIAI